MGKRNDFCSAPTSRSKRHSSQFPRYFRSRAAITARALSRIAAEKTAPPLRGEGCCDAMLEALKNETRKYDRDLLLDALKANFGDRSTVQEALKNLPPLPGEKLKPAPTNDQF